MVDDLKQNDFNLLADDIKKYCRYGVSIMQYLQFLQMLFILF